MRTKEIVHETLKSCWGIDQLKMHDHEFIVSFVGPKDNLRNIFYLHQIWWYPNLKSSLEKNLAPWISSNNSSITGIGYLSRMAILFKALQSTQNPQDPFVFLTNNTSEEKGLVWSNQSQTKEFNHHPLYFCLLVVGISLWSHTDQFDVGLQWNLMILWAFRRQVV